MKKLFISSIALAALACSTGNKTDDDTAHDHSIRTTATRDATVNHLTLSESQIRLANITTQRVKTEPIEQTVLVNGKLVENEELSQVISSRAAGRIEKLFVNETGRMVKKGEPIYQLYSETLLTLQKELLLANEQFNALPEKRYESFRDAARRKLLLYGLTESQIKNLEQTKSIHPSVTFRAPATGVVSEIMISQGQYVSEGSLLMKLGDLSDLWVEAELYPSETSLVRKGDHIRVTITGYENSRVEGVVNFLSPEFRMNSQITVMRAAIPNSNLTLKPGMHAQVVFTHSTKKALTVPTDAVIRDGHGSHLYIQRGHNTFMPKIVKTGSENFEKVEIAEGISEGDTVVVTGAYLLYSELVLKQGTDPVTTHNH